MQIIKLSQTDDREAWLDIRRGVITGTKSKKFSSNKDISSGIFEIIAEKMAIAKDGENAKDRGHRLENEAALKVAEKYNLNIDIDVGFWMSDDGKIGVSPDAAEKSDLPTYAIEVKCLSSNKHLRAIYEDSIAKQLSFYNPIDSLKFSRDDFRPQAKQYFVVNDALETLYFTLYDDRQSYDNLILYVIIIRRSDIESHIEEQSNEQYDAVKKIKSIINVLKEINKEK